ncbi:DUF2628 domain-containing protein [Salipaludibacillus daqingensis]|uniref:DUF2628 domain-containing protein n=1 Tax=Salipaludibacillus daqingensis TaxID=3041001 RepID=UPI002475020B|nr:DUF2628 domain-containing protein [Salipaludibacillus daqingensis]
MSSQKIHPSSIHLSSQNPTVQLIVEENLSYYSNKWEKHPNPSTYSGWNWAAFFFTPAWLAYRHMYTWTFLFFLLYLLGIIIVAFLPALVHFTILPEPAVGIWKLTYPFLINVFFGLKGNAFYTKRVIMIAQQKKGIDTRPTAPLFNKTGRSWISAIVSPAVIWILLIFPYQSVEAWTFHPSLPPGVYIFSDSEPTPQGIFDVKQPFVFEKYDARINFLYYGDEPVGDRSFNVKLYYKEDENDEWMIERERSYRFFSSDRVALDLIDAEDPAAKVGEYRLEIYLDDQLKSTEEFIIVPPNM